MIGTVDQVLNVRYSLDILKGSIGPGCVRLMGNNGNTIMSFYPRLDVAPNGRPRFSQIPDATFNLCDFSVMETSPNEVLVIMSSPSEKFLFSLETPADKEKFVDYISHKVRLVRSDLNPRLYKLESLDYGPSPFVSTSLPAGDRLRERVNIGDIEALLRVPEDFTPKAVTGEFASEDLYNAAVAPGSMFTAFKTLLPKSDKQDATFAEVRKQWAMLTPEQYTNHKELRKCIKAWEQFILAHDALFDKFKDKKKIQKRTFEVLQTYTIYNWDGVSYCDDAVSLIFPLLDAYIDQYGEDDANLESELFDLFAAFWENHQFGQIKGPKKQDFISKVLDQAGNRIGTDFKPLLHVLAQKHVSTLDFMRTDVSRWFVDLFKVDVVKVLWLSALSFGDWQEFFVNFIIALLLQFAVDLKEVNPLSAKDFIEKYNEIKTNVDIRKILYSVKETIQRKSGK